MARANGKALYDLHPELEERVPLLRINSEDEISNTATGTTFFQAATSYNNYMWLQKAINVLANNIAPLPLLIGRVSGQDTEYLSSHSLLPILENPNPEMSIAELSRQWVIDMMLGGEQGWEIVKGVRGNSLLELWPRTSDSIIVKPSSVRYRRVGSYMIDDGQGEPYPLLPEEFIHFKFYNPLQPFRGLTPISAIKLSIVIDQLAQAWSRLFFKNSARPDFAIIAPEGTTETEKKEIIKRLDNHSGQDGYHKAIVLEEGVTDIKTFSFAPKDMEWLNQREFSRDEVAAIVGVPDELMGFGKDTYENFDTADRVLWTLTIIPLIGSRDGTLTRFFRRTGQLKANEKIITDTRSVPQLQEDKTGKINNAKSLFSMGVPVNTASEYLNMGLPNIPFGDIGYLPFGLSQIGIEPPAPEPAPAADPAPVVDPPVVDEPPAKAVDNKRKSVEYGSVEHETLWKKLQARIDVPVGGLKRIAKKEFQRQQNEIGEKLRAGKIYGRGRYKDDGQVPPPPEDLFDLEDECKKFIESFRGKVTETVNLVGTDELAALGVTGVFDISRPEVVAAITEILSAVARKTNETTWNDLVDLFKEAEANGEGIAQIQERLSSYFGDRKSDYQTERIARTTMTGASNAGSVEAWKQSEVVSDKTWISALIPERTRDAHSEAHGQTVGLSEMFSVDGENLMYPGDPSGSPGNIINCLCGTTAVVEE
jgi:HK97 family phage portal protein